MGISIQIKRLEKAMRGVAERAVRNFGRQILIELIRTTPVDTGWARANWLAIASRSEPAPDQPVGSPERVDIAPQNQSFVTIRGYTLEQGNLYIVSNAPHIGRLNLGWSQQAPAGFVQKAVAVAAQKARNFRIR